MAGLGRYTRDIESKYEPWLLDKELKFDGRNRHVCSAHKAYVFLRKMELSACQCLLFVLTYEQEHTLEAIWRF